MIVNYINCITFGANDITMTNCCLDITLRCQCCCQSAPLYLLGHSGQNEMKHHFFSHGMLLVPALLSCYCIISGTILFIRWRQLKCDTDDIVNGILLFGRSRWLKQDAIWPLQSCDANVGIPGCWQHALSVAPLHLLVQDDQNEMQHNFFNHLTLLALVSASCDTTCILIAPLHLLGQDVWSNVQHKFVGYVMLLKLESVSHDTMRYTMMFLVVMWCHWHQHQHHVMPVASSVTPLHLFGQDNQNEVLHNFCSYSAIDTGFSLTWCQQCHHWHPSI